MKQKLLLSSLIVLFCFLESMAQQRTITGTVISQTGTPLVGASVIVVGQNLGVRTGSDGTFSINVPANAKQLEIKLRSLERFPGRNRRPDPGGIMQQVVIPLELEDTERISLGIVDKRDITQRSDDKEHRRV